MRSSRWAIALSIAGLAAAGGTAVAIASGGSITGFPNQINMVNLEGYKLVTSYPLGTNTGNTFQQTYAANGNVSATGVVGPFKGQTFSSKYIAMPVGSKQLMVTWYTPDGVLTDVFVMNFNDGIVSDVAPGKSPASLGIVRIDRVGAHAIP